MPIMVQKVAVAQVVRSRFLPAAAGASHAFFHDSGVISSTKGVGDLIYLIRLSGSDSKRFW